MQIVAIPLFNKDMGEEAYVFRELKENILFSTAQALNLFDGASTSETLRVLDKVGLDAFTMGKQIFVPINEVALMGNLSAQCKEPSDKIIFVLEKPLSNRGLYLPFMLSLRNLGYRFAINYPIKLVENDPALQNSSYIFLSQREEKQEEILKTLQYVKRFYRNLTPIAVHIYTHEILQKTYGQGYGMYESRLYKATGSNAHIAPLKLNAIRLINTVQDVNFDFTRIAKIVSGDPALTISLFKLVNSSSRMRNKITSIPHAVSMMGQREVLKWVTTAVSRSLGDDRPNEMTRISLVRAKFLENLAPIFEFAHMSGELFLLGLFSVIDNILDVPMEQALKQVVVSENIRKALVDNAGIFHPIFSFVKDYENAAWSNVSRQMIVHDINGDALSEAYINTLLWYRDLVSMDEEPEESEEPDKEA
ncbi:MAG: HDOD domain-containing protein [Oscillospiraceae bacterium]|nr:HDOD domain-containing protein [Oscillospiraceae bacterium]